MIENSKTHFSEKLHLKHIPKTIIIDAIFHIYIYVFGPLSYRHTLTAYLQGTKKQREMILCA